MNRSRYVPFERNRYFYGKLLTVRDFISEQTYFSDKRRLLNRLLFGSGVITGLQVVAVDEKSISIETGVALDALGREIVVPSPVTLKLSMLEGFTNNEYAKNVYLCIAYDEKGKEPVHSVAGASGRNEEVNEHNRILEGYRLFVREQAPSPASFEYTDLLEDTSIWYEDSQVRIMQSVPRYVTPGQVFEMRLHIEKTLQTAHVEFEYMPDWAMIESADPLLESSNGKIVFSEPTDGGQASYSMTYMLRAGQLPAGESVSHGKLRARSGSVRLVVGDRVITDLYDIKQSIEISEESAERRMHRAFQQRSLDRAIESPAEPCIYLAKLILLQMGPTYVIDRVETMPFDEFVINPSISQRIGRERKEQTHDRAGHESTRTIQTTPTMQASAPLTPAPPIYLEEDIEEEEHVPTQTVATGLHEMSIIPRPKAKWWHRRQRHFYTEEIQHGLGEGSVLVKVGLSDEREELAMPELWDRRDAIYYDTQEVFLNSDFDSGLPKVSIGIIVYPKKGTFRLGVKLMEKTERARLRLRWWAVKEPELNDELKQGASSLGAQAQFRKEAAATKF
jgi:hypothetical protein